MKGFLRCNDKVYWILCNVLSFHVLSLGSILIGTRPVSSLLYLHMPRKFCKFVGESYFNIFITKEHKIVILNF